MLAQRERRASAATSSARGSLESAASPCELANRLTDSIAPKVSSEPPACPGPRLPLPPEALRPPDPRRPSDDWAGGGGRRQAGDGTPPSPASPTT